MSRRGTVEKLGQKQRNYNGPNLMFVHKKKLAIPAVYYYSRYMLTFFEEIKYRPLVFLHIKLS